MRTVKSYNSKEQATTAKGKLEFSHISNGVKYVQVDYYDTYESALRYFNRLQTNRSGLCLQAHNTIMVAIFERESNEWTKRNEQTYSKEE